MTQIDDRTGDPQGRAVPGQDDTQAVTAQVGPKTRLDKILAQVPRALSSHVHIIFLACLGVFLVLLPLVGVTVSAKAELIGGNYTNVTSDLGACIAAGLTVHLVKRDRKRTQQLDDMFKRLHERHDVLHRDVQLAVSVCDRIETSVRGEDTR